MTQPPPARPRPGPATAPQPLAWSASRVALAGVALWGLALAVTLAVPALHTGDRDWWPWTCVAGMTLGLFGYGYIRRGRGNAEDAR